MGISPPACRQPLTVSPRVQDPSPVPRLVPFGHGSKLIEVHVGSAAKRCGNLYPPPVVEVPAPPGLVELVLPPPKVVGADPPLSGSTNPVEPVKPSSSVTSVGSVSSTSQPPSVKPRANAVAPTRYRKRWRFRIGRGTSSLSSEAKVDVVISSLSHDPTTGNSLFRNMTHYWGSGTRLPERYRVQTVQSTPGWDTPKKTSGLVKGETGYLPQVELEGCGGVRCQLLRAAC